MNRSKAKGTRWETELAGYLLDSLTRPIHRLAQHGTNDIGDLAIEGVPVTIEAKNANKIELGEWMTETVVEQRQRGTRWGALFIRRRGRACGDAYVVMTLAQWCDLVSEAVPLVIPPTPIHKPHLAVARHPSNNGGAA